MFVINISAIIAVAIVLYIGHMAANLATKRHKSHKKKYSSIQTLFVTSVAVVARLRGMMDLSMIST